MRINMLFSTPRTIAITIDCKCMHNIAIYLESPLGFLIVGLLWLEITKLHKDAIVGESWCGPITLEENLSITTIHRNCTLHPLSTITHYNSGQEYTI